MIATCPVDDVCLAGVVWLLGDKGQKWDKIEAVDGCENVTKTSPATIFFCFVSLDYSLSVDQRGQIHFHLRGRMHGKWYI